MCIAYGMVASFTKEACRGILKRQALAFHGFLCCPVPFAIFGAGRFFVIRSQRGGIL
jgi:hypothetical protein